MWKLLDTVPVHKSNRTTDKIIDLKLEEVSTNKIRFGQLFKNKFTTVLTDSCNIFNVSFTMIITIYRTVNVLFKEPIMK